MAKEHSILMSAPMVVALLDDRKRMTRRVITKRNSEFGSGKIQHWEKLCWDGSAIYTEKLSNGIEVARRCLMPYVDGKPRTGQYLHVPYDWAGDASVFRVFPKYEVGDTLWVQETWRPYSEDEVRIQYRADNKIIDYADKPRGYFYGCGQAWRSSSSMPRWASRITLEITAIRAEQLNSITEEDAITEGLPARSETGYVWIYEFKRIK